MTATAITDLADLWSPSTIDAALRELDLGPVRSGSTYRIACPSCGRREAWVQPANSKPPWISCNRRNKCELAREGGGASLFRLLAGRLGGSAAAIGFLGGPRVAPPAPAQVQADRPPLAEVEALWRAARPMVAESGEPDPDPRASELLGAKGSDAGDVAAYDLARLTPLGGPELAWWPFERERYRIVVRAWEPDGSLASIQARSVYEGDPRKTVWPSGCSARGLLFASSEAQAMLRGHRIDLDGALIVEGLTAWIAASCWAARRARPLPPRLAVLGIAAGGAQALGSIRWPHGCEIRIATDSDAAGQRYAVQARAALPTHVRVLRSEVH